MNESSAAPNRQGDVQVVESAIDAMRRGRVLLVTGDAPADSWLVMSAELAEPASLAQLEALAGGNVAARLVISQHRAAALKLTNAAPAAGAAAVVLEPEPWANLPLLQAVADPLKDLAVPLKGPFRVSSRATSCDGDPLWAALTLARHARLLPAVLACPVSQQQAGQPESPGLAGISARTILEHEQAQVEALHIVTRARVPLQQAHQCEIVAFRPADGSIEHLALVINQPQHRQPVLARIHSECLTGDLLGSLKCDCGPQLQGAIAAISANPSGGVLLYMGQEGRGIGLINKLRAYALQDQGYDTVDANLRLGFADDERSFHPAARMLSLLGFDAVRLMTNNPRKVAGLEACGITVTERVPHQLGENPHNSAYLATKRDRAGHLL